MSIAKFNTFLSPYIRKLLVETGDEFQSITKPFNNNHYVTINKTLNWAEIADLIGNPSDCFNIHDLPSEWFSSTICKTWVVFSEAFQCLRNWNQQELEQLWHLSSWTKKKTEIQQCYSYFISNSPTVNTEVVLFLTSLLERSLGNIFLLKGQNVPFLLRDLLSTEELKSILGVVPIVFIQILLGSPVGLNLRNVTWHGFPSPNEVKPELAAVLFVIIASIGELLILKQIEVDSLPCRPQIKNLLSYSSELEDCFSDLDINYKTEVTKILFHSPLISQTHQIYWETIIEHFFKERYGKCLMLLLPQLEHLLRSIFCWANKCPERTLTAESTEFYTTLDEILSEYVNESEMNKIRVVLGDNIILMLQDVFVHQKGPRIRDRLSHGECDLCDIPKNLVNHIICITLAIVFRVGDEIDLYTLKHEVAVSDPSIKKSNLNCDSSSKLKALQLSIKDSCEKYESKFHISSLVKTTIANSSQELAKWKGCPMPSTADLDYKSWEEAMRDDKSYVPSLKKNLEKLLSNTIYVEDTQEKYSFYDLVNSGLRYNVATLYRCKNEIDILNLLKQIGDSVHIICIQVTEGLKEKQYLFTSRFLRSRQRETYKRMLNTVPSLHSAVQCIILLLLVMVVNVNSLPSEASKEYQKLLRMLKHILQYVQNVTTYTNAEKNRWDEIKAITAKFAQEIYRTLNNDNFVTIIRKCK